MRSKFNIYFDENNKIFLIFSLLLSFLTICSHLSVGPSDPKFIQDFVKITFNFLLLFAAIFSTFMNLDWKYNYLIKQEIVFSLIFTSLLIFRITKYSNELNQFIYIFLPFNILHSILEDGTAMFWAFYIILINFIIFIIVNLLNKQNLNNNKNKLMISKSVLVYVILNFSIWFLTHMLYVGSNAIYVSEELKLIDSIVDVSIANNLSLKDKNINVYNIDNYKDFRKDTLLKYSTIKNKKEDIDLLYNWFQQIDTLRIGKDERLKVKFEDITYFWQWAAFSFNSADVKMSKDKIIMSGIVFPAKRDLSTTQIKQAFLYIKIVKDKIYTYVDINSTFKDNKENLIFNEFYIAFHFIYWFIFYIIFKYHSKIFNRQGIK